MAVQFDQPGSAAYDVTADPHSQYYIGPIHGDHASGDEIRAEVTTEVDDDIAKGWLGDAVTSQARDAEIQKRYEEQIAKARQSLDQDIQLRNPGAPPTTMWDNATHEQMQQTITDNADSAAVAVTSEEWVSLGNELTEHQQNLADAINDSMSDWQGSGGDAAREHLASVGKWLGNTAQGSSLTGRQQEIHSQALNETQKQMAANPPVQFSAQDANARLQTITDPVQFAQQASQDMATLAQQQASRQQAARIMTQYDDTVGGAIATPEFAAPPKLGQGVNASTGGTLPSNAGNGTLTPRLAGSAPGATTAGSRIPAQSGSPADARLPAASTNGDPTGANGIPSTSGTLPVSPYSSSIPGDATGQGAGSSPYSSTSGSNPGVSGVDSPNWSSPGSSYTGSDIPVAGTSPSSYTSPSAITSPTSTNPGIGGIGGIGYTGGTNGDIGSRLNPFGGTGSFPAGEIGGIGGIGGVGGSSGAGSGSGAGGIGGIGSSGLKGGGGSGTGGAASRLSAGAASGAAAAEEAAAARGAAGASGAAGKSGMSGGMPHGGAKKGEGDKEHKAADYLEGDPELFESEQVIAPPVIGDWKKNKGDKKK